MKTERTFPSPEIMIPLKCDVHPWMASYIGVLNHPYFVVTGNDGRGLLKDLHRSDYIAAAWHEHYGELEKMVTLAASERTSIEFAFSAAQ